MGNYKATINIDRALWDEFKNYCKNYPKCSASELLRAMIADEIEKADPDYQPFFQSPLSPSIQAEIESIKIRLDKLETDRTEQTDRTEGTDGTERTDSAEIPIDYLYTNAEVGELEGIAGGSVSRYRNLSRQPKDKTFWERWTYDPSSESEESEDRLGIG